MSEPDEGDDKQFEPTQKKLTDARKKGEIPRSTDLTTAAAYGGFVLAASAIGATILTRLATELTRILANAPDLAGEVFGGGQQSQFGGIARGVVISVSPWFAIPALGAILAIVVQQSFVVAPSKLEPKLSKISVLSNAKNKFGRQGLFEFAKSFAKLLIYSIVLGVFLVNRTPDIVMTMYLHPNLVASVLVETSLSFIMIVLIVAIIVGVVDYFWQHANHLRKNRMSRKELTDEAKQMEGDPHVKQQRRQKAQDIALNQMLTDVPTADVIIVNPQHFAIALKWSRAQNSAPVCVAKGVDEIAARIREVAIENAVPIHRDPPTARALWSTVEIGEQIRSEHFKAVAAAIRFAEKMGKKSKSSRIETQ